MDVSASSASESDDDQKSRKHSKKSKAKHSKSHKKEKKHKKKKKKRYSSSEESSGEEEWVTKEVLGALKPGDSTSKDEKDEQEEGDSWAGVFDSFNQSARKAEQKKRRDNVKSTKAQWDEAKKNALELNPYWKDGGSGLPSTDGGKAESSAKVVGDGGLAWLRKSYLRAKQQAEDEGKSIEEVAVERWGSLEAFYELLEKAEAKASGGSEEKRASHRDRDRPRESSSRFRRPGEADSDDERRDRDRRRSSKHESTSRSSGSRSYDRSGGWRKGGREEPVIEIPPAPPKSAKPPAFIAPEVPVNVSEPEEMDVEEEVQEGLSEKELNELNAKILKAEMLGNEDLAKELKVKLEKSKNVGVSNKPKVKVITKVILDDQDSKRRRKVKPGDTHNEGKRTRYFADDDQRSLQSMFAKEKRTTAEHENAMFAGMFGKGVKTNDDYDLDDAFVDRASSSKTVRKETEREVREALSWDKTFTKTLENCAWCFDGKKLAKHLVVAVGEKTYLCVPPYQSVTEGHCLIIPMAHVESSTSLDEDVWEEMKKFRKALVDMFLADDQDIVFFENARNLKHHPHMFIECVPVPKETGDLAPIYFKKAIQECESEWSQNKKLVELRNRDVRKAVPKGLPYFSVDFGLESGFAHVIEDEQLFPQNFAQEILGGMMELDHSQWRKRKFEDFPAQRAKVMAFLKSWGPYDWTNA